MDQLPTGEATAAVSEPAPSSEPAANDAPPSTSVLSDAPTTDAPEPPEQQTLHPESEATDETVTPSFQAPQYSAQTESILKRINDNAANAAATGTPEFDAAKEQVMKDMQTSDKFPTPTPSREESAPSRGGASESTPANQPALKMDVDVVQTTPGSTRGRGRGGRPRGRGRGGTRGGKRKREDRSDGESDDSEVYTPAVTMTKSGRSVQKPAAFVPPPTSPTTTGKRKRPYRRNPESAVCKVCLRGTSPAGNMIVFCDGCNTPYHQYCHHPPIDDAVVNEVDKEWYCKQCEKERVVPVPESDVADFISAGGASAEQRQRYFASLAPGMLVTLLTRATTLEPDLPVFAPDFQARVTSSTAAAPTGMSMQTASNNQAYLSTSYQPGMMYSTAQSAQRPQSTAGAPQMGTHYMNQSHPQQNYVPDEHPPNYPRPGYGLMRTLPPEQQDLRWLVDNDDRYGVFSHVYQSGMQGPAQ